MAETVKALNLFSFVPDGVRSNRVLPRSTATFKKLPHSRLYYNSKCHWLALQKADTNKTK